MHRAAALEARIDFGMPICGRAGAGAVGAFALVPLQLQASPAWQYREADMARHRFKVGQVVSFTPARPGVPTAGRRYQIVRLLPPEGGEFQYRVKAIGETFERMAKENELTRLPSDNEP